MAGVLDITIIPGETFSLFNPITWKDGNGNAVNLTGVSAAFYIKKDAQSPIVLFDLHSGYGRITCNSSGEVSLVIYDNETAAFEWKKAQYSLWVYLTDGSSKLLLAGKVTVDQEKIK